MGKTRVNASVRIFYVILFALAGIGMCLGGYFMMLSAFEGKYVDLFSLIFALLIGAGGVFFLGCIFFMEKIIITNDTLFIQYLTGQSKKKIPLRDIESYIEVEKKAKNNTWQELTIYTPTQKHKIISSHYTEYLTIRRILTKDKSYNTLAEQWKKYFSNRNFGWGFCIFAVLFLCIFSWLYSSRNNDPITSSELIFVEGRLINPLEIKRSSAGRRSRRKTSSITVQVNPYSEFNFKLSDKGVRAARALELVNEVRPGATIRLQILKEQYQKKLTETMPLEFWDKYRDYDEISIYGIESEDKVYLDYRLYIREIEEDKEDPILGILFIGGFFLFMLGVGLYYLLTNKPPKRKWQPPKN